MHLSTCRVPRQPSSYHSERIEKFSLGNSNKEIFVERRIRVFQFYFTIGKKKRMRMTFAFSIFFYFASAQFCFFGFGPLVHRSKVSRSELSKIRDAAYYTIVEWFILCVFFFLSEREIPNFANRAVSGRRWRSSPPDPVQGNKFFQPSFSLMCLFHFNFIYTNVRTIHSHKWNQTSLRNYLRVRRRMCFPSLFHFFVCST